MLEKKDRRNGLTSRKLEAKIKSTVGGLPPKIEKQLKTALKEGRKNYR